MDSRDALELRSSPFMVLKYFDIFITNTSYGVVSRRRAPKQFFLSRPQRPQRLQFVQQGLDLGVLQTHELLQLPALRVKNGVGLPQLGDEEVFAPRRAGPQQPCFHPASPPPGVDRRRLQDAGGRARRRAVRREPVAASRYADVVHVPALLADNDERGVVSAEGGVALAPPLAAAAAAAVAAAAGPPAALRLAAWRSSFPATPCFAWNSAILILHSFKTRSMAPARQLHTSMKSSAGSGTRVFSARALSVCQLYTFGDILVGAAVVVQLHQLGVEVRDHLRHEHAVAEVARDVPLQARQRDLVDPLGRGLSSSSVRSAVTRASGTAAALARAGRTARAEGYAAQGARARVCGGARLRLVRRAGTCAAPYHGSTTKRTASTPNPNGRFQFFFFTFGSEHIREKKCSS